MSPLTESQNRNRGEIVLYAILFLFFLQLLTDFIEAIYAFGLLGTGLPPEMVTVLFLFSPLILLVLPRKAAGWALLCLGFLMLLCRVAEPVFDTRSRMFIAGVGVASFLIAFPLLLWTRDDEQTGVSGPLLGLGLAIGLSLSILFRALDSGNDLSTSGWGQAVGWFLALVGAALLFLLHRPAGSSTSPPTEAAQPKRSGFWRTTALCLGIISVFILCYFSFASPNVIARWTGANYLLVVAVTVLALLIFALVWTSRPQWLASLSPLALLAWNALFVLAMTLTIASHQVSFPATPGGYPLSEPVVTLLHQVPLFLMLILFPVILLDFMLLTQELVVRTPSLRAPSLRALGGGFGLASLYLLLMVFAHIFTTVYDYIPVVGPFFRDKFWLVYLLAGIGLALPVLLVGKERFNLAAAARKLSSGQLFPALMAAIALLTLAGAILGAPRPIVPGPDSSLTVLTYNIQQGYSEDGLKNFDGQLDLIRSVDADIIGLQESDTNRIAGGNSDVVRYMADNLDLYSYYGPKTVPGTFGIALLSRYPIDNPRTFYMYSEGEQTATIEAQITADGHTYNIYVTHLGNSGPIVQQEAILQEVEGTDNVILMGDFNFRPDSDQYRLTTAMLEDSWLVKWPQGNLDQGIDPADRIDHIFVSPGTAIAGSQYLAEPDSDHPAMVTIIDQN